MSSRIIIVSNRLPVTVVPEVDRLVAKRSVGGLATALSPLINQYDTLWVGWTGMRRSLKPTELKQLELPEQLVPVDLSASLVRRYYDRAANGTIWPSLLHFAPLHPCNEQDWQALMEVTKRFAQTIKSICRPDDVIWIHDYHFMLLPQFLREADVHNRIGFFLHTPFPESSFLRQLPYHKQMLASLAQADVLGLQTERDVRRFTAAFEAAHPLRYIHATVQAFPIGIDYDAHRTACALPEVCARIAGAAELTKGKRVIFSISRLDYVKGIVTQLEAVEKLLHDLPAGERKSIIYKLVVAPSRENISEYKMLKRDIERVVERINKRFGTTAWQPIDYSYETYGFHDIIAWFQLAEICLVAPWADGMNLVAKEYVAARQNDDGMLVLSQSIGTAFQLKHAVLVDPLDVHSVASGLMRALHMPQAERAARWKSMRSIVKQQDIFWWTDMFLEALMSPAGSLAASLVGGVYEKGRTLAFKPL